MVMLNNAQPLLGVSTLVIVNKLFSICFNFLQLSAQHMHSYNNRESTYYCVYTYAHNNKYTYVHSCVSTIGYIIVQCPATVQGVGGRV